MKNSRGESAAEFVVSQRPVVIDDDVFHQYYFLTRRSPGPVSVAFRDSSVNSSAASSQNLSRIVIAQIFLLLSQFGPVKDDKDRGKTQIEKPIPDEFKEEVEKWRHELVEKVAETDDHLMEKYLTASGQVVEHLVDQQGVARERFKRLNQVNDPRAGRRRFVESFSRRALGRVQVDDETAHFARVALDRMLALPGPTSKD